MSELTEYRFEQLCTITRGASPRPIKDFISTKGMPWVKISDATSSDSKFIRSTKENIKLEGVSKSVKVYPGDFILSNSATPGLPKFMDIEACIHDGWLLLRDFKNIDKEYAYWLLLNDRPLLVSQGNGSVFTNLKTDILKNHKVKIPPPPEQKAIAGVLGALDDKIDLNRRTNQTLEAMARTLFKDWFIDFGPTKAKMAGQPPYLTPDLWDLFPDRLNPTTGLPEGWEESTAGNIFDIGIGKTPPRLEAQ